MPDTSVCLDCGYSLRGLPSPICPECGRGFDPGNVATYGDPSRPLWLGLSRPPRRWPYWLAVWGAMAILFALSSPGMLSPVSLAVALGVLALIATDHVAPLIFLGWMRLRRKSVVQLHPAWRNKRRWLRLLAFAVLVGAAALYPWPAWLRFQLGRAAFVEVVNSKSGRTPWTRIGLHIVGRVARTGDGMVFFETGEEFPKSYGFLYVPGPPPGSGSNLQIQHSMSSDWHIATMRWY